MAFPRPVQNLSRLYLNKEKALTQELKVVLAWKGQSAIQSKQHRSLKLFLFFLFLPFPFLSLFSDIFLDRTSLIRSKNTFEKHKTIIIPQNKKVVFVNDAKQNSN